MLGALRWRVGKGRFSEEALWRLLAQAVLLAVEYDAKPPFVGGSPRQALPRIVQLVRATLGGADTTVDEGRNNSIGQVKRHHVAKEAHAGLRRALATELSEARAARAQRDVRAEWSYLERAHVISQPMAGAHIRTHAAMLGAAVRRRDLNEVLGQLVRIVAAGPGSLTGRYPLGNTGGAKVSALLPMEIPDDLRSMFEAPVTSKEGLDPYGSSGRNLARHSDKPGSWLEFLLGLIPARLRYPRR